MTLQKQVGFWIGGLVLLILSLYVLRGVLLPFVAGLALAYFLDPIVRRLAKLGLPRTLGALFVIGTFVVLFIGLMFLIVPILANQLTAFIARLPGYVVQLQTLATEQNREWLQKVLGERLPDVSRSVGDLVSQSVGWAAGFLQGLWSGGAAFISLFSLIVVTPVVAFYLLNDWPKIMVKIDSWLPLKHRETILGLMREIDRALAGFLRGQAAVCGILMIFYGVALTASGLNFGLLIGISIGFLSFIPYVGSLTGLILSLGVAIVQFWPNWSMVAIIIGIFVVGQFLEAYVLYPNLVGESVGLHPVSMMFALFAFGALFGFVGLLLAVPLAAAIGVLTRFAIRQYLASPLYTGVPREGPARSEK
ncbi:AI-2E family transporter [Phreatobacter stygius]|uniref:AI-2E family transporter n=1 Tax=Phreatobacter stygius TaxID=1940610 RepID=A0A4D7AUR9_9HYPH|nr:AI-2E family transporter [Phreatobacter stygius]QCI62773.1 AI-2E family transporter [Phreatobacter stygius]QCI68950.1 AI-2E family transporter [Phreatobacter stygius]